MNDIILQGDVRSCLKQLEDGSVQCVITSPPYWGLRDYGTATWEGGSSSCDHKGKPMATKAGFNERYTGKAPVDTDKQSECLEFYKDVCPKCGARRIDSQIGLEPTPDAYVADLVEVFREVKRVLRDDGVLWLNLGDSYANNGTGGNGATGGRDKSTLQSQMPPIGTTPVHKSVPPGLKPKDLIGIPWMVAFALRADGWYLRSDIIWNKPNPMPESVTDRCTKSHEHIFMLTKSERYYYDAEAIKEANADPDRTNYKPGTRAYAEGNTEQCNTERTRRNDGFQKYADGAKCDGRNKRDVWTVVTQPCAEAHFATFPPKLIEPMILAGTKEGDTILDPFMGSGTTAIQAVRWHRHYLGCELNPEYVKMAERRINDMVGPLFQKAA